MTMIDCQMHTRHLQSLGAKLVSRQTFLATLKRMPDGRSPPRCGTTGIAMSHRDPGPTVAIHFYATAPYPCSYLAGRQARSQVAIPAEAIDGEVYSQLVKLGFRRSGLYTYRPYCDSCQACVPVRIPVERFTPGRTQRKVARRLEAMQVRLLPLEFDAEHYALYRWYQQSRHAGGGMSDDDPHQYSEFILKSGVDSMLAEFRLDGELKMVSLIDRLADGLSAVYTFTIRTTPSPAWGVQCAVAGGADAATGPALSLSGLLDTRMPENVLQGDVPALAGLDGRALGGAGQAAGGVSGQ